MPQLDLERIANQLREEKTKLLTNSEKVREADRAAGAQTYADEADLAVSALNQSVSMKMRDRERSMLLKIEQALGRSLPAGFTDNYQRRTLTRFRADLHPIEGVREFIATFEGLPRCIASSSSPDRLALCLEVLEMEALFQGRVFSASTVARGKPHPDIFLHAAAEIRVRPERCIVIEDSASGVVAARAAGATVVGLLAAGHIRDGHGAVLAEAGAHYVVHTYREAEEVVRNLVRT